MEIMRNAVNGLCILIFINAIFLIGTSPQNKNKRIKLTSMPRNGWMVENTGLVVRQPTCISWPSHRNTSCLICKINISHVST